MVEFDKGPPAALAAHFAAMPSYAPHRALYWYDWGPVFYRGRLDGSAKLLGIASDPGPTEQLVCRTLVGDAGQRVQGFLAKLGLTHSYALVNAHPFALHPSRGAEGKAVLAELAYRTWRNKLFDLITDSSLEAIVAFGDQAHEAIDLWDGRPTGIPVLKVPHPSSRDPSALATAWHAAIIQLRGLITADAGGDATGANYGTSIKESDYAPIPKSDLPFGVPAWFGDDAWGRKASPRHNNSVGRDGDHKIVWQAPSNQP
jgi:uracil-DNA glycosylase